MTHYSTARAAATLSGFAVLSPLAGIAVEMALAWRFGASLTVDAFRIGALLLLFGQQLFVLQILPHAVVPVFAEYCARGEEREAWRAVISLASLLTLPVMLISAFIFFKPAPAVALLAPGLAGASRAAATLFLRGFLPAGMLLVWSGVAAGALYAHKIFWVPPAAQLAGNVSLVAMILCLGRTLAARSLVAGVLFGAVLGAALYLWQILPLLRRAGGIRAGQIDFTHPGMRQIVCLALPLLGGVAASQWAMIVISRALSEQPAGTLAQFGYAWKLCLIVAVAPQALATVLFPRFSDAVASASQEEFRELCGRALRMAMFLALPLTALLIALREPVVRVLLERGAFSADSSQAVARLFGVLLAGAPAAVAAVYLEKIVYALKRTWLPACTQLFTAVALTAIAPGVALRGGAMHLAALYIALLWLSTAAMFLWLAWGSRALAAGPLVGFSLRLALLAGVSGWVAARFAERGAGLGSSAALSAASAIVAGIFTGGPLFFGLALLTRTPEAAAFGRYLLWQRSAWMGGRPSAASR